MASDAVAVLIGDPAAEAKASTDWFVSISGQLRFLSTGERAALRRMPLGRSAGSDGVLIKLLSGAKVPTDLYERDYTRWRAVVQVAALLAGTGARASHDEDERVGTALYDADVSEKRLMRFLAARDGGLNDQLGLMARLLSRRNKPVNLWTLYHLIGRDERKAESARLRIAQDYYAAQARSQKDNSNDD
ncbi:type I-E CRISPR-associated protein Cse2/CasB [Sphingomonas adhaesiva]|uniref:type I-E CRISPR-associated protein Cse2/CasB n=1 Tax=Sphingomonas adhaesiva TaxID=28212 RepID=UPI002FF9A915